MDSYWSSSLSLSPAETVQFGAVCLFLSALPFLPALGTPLPRSPYFPLCPEVLILVTGLVYAVHTRWQSLVHRSVLVGVLLLLGYEGYDAIVYTATQRNGIFYEDLQLVDNLTYFLFNVGSWQLIGGGLLALAGIGGLIGLVDKSLRLIAQYGNRGSCRAVLLAAHLIAWPLVIVVGPAQDWGTPNLTYQRSNEQVRIRTVATKALANARASIQLSALLDSLDTAPVDSTYHDYQTVSLAHRPSIYLLSIESYGTVLDRHPDLRGPYRHVLRHTEDTLRANGWHAASARLDSPVRGGRSWLAIASLLTGVRVDRQLVFNRFQSNTQDIPHLVRFLNHQGYHTVGLQPFTFARPGLPVRNLYDFDETLYRDDLNYEGPSYGLADAPDQYSLRYAHATELAPSEAPFFLFFETVSSHALWNYGLAPYLPDWRRFNAFSGSSQQQKTELARVGSTPTPLLPDSVTAPRIYDQPIPQRYLQHICYDLYVIRDYLLQQAPAGSLVLLLGDHQPPLLDTQTNTVPFHVLSTDSTLVNRVRRHGLTDGLVPTDGSPTLRQEGLYSLLVHLLSDAPSTAPAYRPEGVSPSLLVQ